MKSQLLFPAHSLYYDGLVQMPTGQHTFQSINPATGKPLADFIEASAEDCDAAIRSAERAFTVWSQTPVQQRSRVLLRVAQILRERNDDLALMETRDTGKAYSETRTGDIAMAADSIEFYANLVGGGGWHGETYSIDADTWVETTKEPLGVCVGIGAWNYPLQIAVWKAAPCLAAGNTMVYKPSEHTPIHGTVLAAIFTEAGCPPGTFNIVQGSGSVGSYLTSHRSVSKISFTGQVSTGRTVASTAVRGMKYVTMELGGKSACIVLADCDLEKAVDGAMMANFFSSGQICTNGTRVFVPKALKTAFERLLKKKLKHGIRMGPPEDPSTNFGPLSSKMQYEKVVGYIRHGVHVDKATLIYNGELPPQLLAGSSSPFATGYWVPPAVFSDCADSMRIVEEEIFGPVMCILTYETVDEVIERANSTPLGLAAGVLGQDVCAARRVVKKLQAGITWINTWGDSPAIMAVGGYKMSGLGVENGKRGLDAWYHTKSTFISEKGTVGTVFDKL